MAQEQTTQTAGAAGTVRKSNADKGILAIAHGPVPALQWLAMVMPSLTSAEQIAQVREGDEIRFEFITDGNGVPHHLAGKALASRACRGR